MSIDVAHDGFTSALDNPEAAKAAVAAAFGPEQTDAHLADPPASIYPLPGGVLAVDGELWTDIEVRELTGAHEERLAKARQSGSIVRFISTLLECGIVKIGVEDATPSLIRQMLIGDRDAALLAIRRATYGDEIRMQEVPCPSCGEKSDLTITLDDIPTRKLKDPILDRQLKIELRKGRKALVRLAIGSDQEAMLSRTDLTPVEANTILLSRCVSEIVDAAGVSHPVLLKPSLVREGLSIPDRRTILDALTQGQPGPLWDQITYEHEACGREVAAPMGLAELFLDM